MKFARPVPMSRALLTAISIDMRTDTKARHELVFGLRSFQRTCVEIINVWAPSTAERLGRIFDNLVPFAGL